MRYDISQSFIKPLTIGTLQTRHNLVLAPLAGISNYPFRQICREFGADLTFTEMVSIDGLLYNNETTRRLLKIYPREQPVGFQFFGNDESIFRRVIPETLSLQPAVLDLNFGCPVRKVVSKGAGAALLKDIEKMQKLVSLVKSISTVPVMAKIRLGWDHQSIVVHDAARAIEAGGADAMTVHGRTRSQGYSGKADWDAIAEVKATVSIPVIGNGDVFDEESARDMFRHTAVDGIMLARGTFGRPWLFQKILHYLETGEQREAPGMPDRYKTIERHFRLEAELYGEEIALKQMRKHLGWYLHGLPHAAKMRNQVFRLQNYEEVRQFLDESLNGMGN